MSYRIAIANSAQKELKRIPPEQQRRVADAIDQLRETPIHRGVKKLHGKHSDTFRIRAGNFRIIYEIEGETVAILKIADRKDAYNIR